MSGDNWPKVGLVKVHPNDPEYAKVVGAAIVRRTGKPWVHVKLLLQRPGDYQQRVYTFESTVEEEPGRILPFSGAKLAQGLGAADAWWQPETSWDASELDDLWTWCAMQVWLGRKYNVLQLLFDWVIFPTRQFWTKLGRVPFGAPRHGGVCSAAAGEGVTAAAPDKAARYFHGLAPATLVPGDFADMPGWEPCTP